MEIKTSNQKFEINEIGKWVYLLKDNRLLSGEIMEVKISQFYDKLGNMQMGIQYKIADTWYFASEVFNDFDAVTAHLKSTCQMIA